MQDKDGSPLKILAVEPSCDGPAIYAVFCSDMGLYHYDKMDKTLTLVAKIPNIRLPDPPMPDEDGVILPSPNFEIKLDCRYPYICVSERYGLNAAVVNIRTGAIRKFSRENDEARVTSFSIGFLEIYTPGEWIPKGSGRGLLIHQTKWNHLDITDLETGELLTRRNPPPSLPEALPRTSEFLDSPDTGRFDYFHSLIHVSPEQKYFLSNGWVWTPVDVIYCYKAEDFLKEGEKTACTLDFQGGYNWDRPCTFITDDIFVIAADDKTADLGTPAEVEGRSSPPGEEEKPSYKYHQLLFYRLSDAKQDVRLLKYPADSADSTEPEEIKPRYRGYLEPFKTLDTDIFDINEYGEVKGKLFYDMDNYEDSGESSLIALSSKGAYVINMEGKILRHIRDITDEWGYHVYHHCFYHVSDTDVEKYLAIEETVDKGAVQGADGQTVDGHSTEAEQSTDEQTEAEDEAAWKYDTSVCLIEERPLFVNFPEISLATRRLMLKPLGCHCVNILELGMLLENVVAIGGGVPCEYTENAFQYLRQSLHDLNEKKNLRMAILRKPDYEFVGLINLYNIDTEEYELDLNLRANFDRKAYEKEALLALLDWTAINMPFKRLRLCRRDESTRAKAPPLDESKYTIISQPDSREGMLHSYKELTLPLVGTYEVQVKAEIRTDVFDVFSDDFRPWCVSTCGWFAGYGDTEEEAFKDFYEQFPPWK
jgi:hypothetical protein